MSAFLPLFPSLSSSFLAFYFVSFPLPGLSSPFLPSHVLSSLLLLSLAGSSQVSAENLRHCARHMLACWPRFWRSQSCSNVNSSNEKKIPRWLQYHLHAGLLWIKWSHKWNLSCKAHRALGIQYLQQCSLLTDWKRAAGTNSHTSSCRSSFTSI